MSAAVEDLKITVIYMLTALVEKVDFSRSDSNFNKEKNDNK